MRFRFLLASFLLFPLLPGKLAAQDGTLDFQSYFWKPRVSGTIKFGDGVTQGNAIDLRSDLGIEDRDWGSVWKLGFRENNCRFVLRYEELTLSGQKTLPRTIAFDETSLAAGSLAKSRFQYDEIGVDFEGFDWVTEEFWGWAGLSASLILVEPQIATPSAGSDDDLLVSFAPGAKAGGEWKFWGPMRLGGEIQVDLFSHEYHHGLRFDSALRAGLETYLACELGRRGKLLAGYRVRGMILENSDTFLEENEARLAISGFFVSLEIRF